MVDLIMIKHGPFQFFMTSHTLPMQGCLPSYGLNAIRTGFTMCTKLTHIPKPIQQFQYIIPRHYICSGHPYTSIVSMAPKNISPLGQNNIKFNNGYLATLSQPLEHMVAPYSLMKFHIFLITCLNTLIIDYLKKYMHNPWYNGGLW